jgi:DNA-binding beta-propeller fold protein YncE
VKIQGTRAKLLNLQKNDLMKISSLIIGISVLISSSLFAQQDFKELKIKKSIHISGNGNWDDLTYDDSSQRVFVTHDDCVQVIDLKTGKQVGIIQHVPGAHSVALAPDFGKGYISAGKADSVFVFDMVTYRIKAKVATGKNPSAITYDMFSQQVFVCNREGHSLTAIDCNVDVVGKTVKVHGIPSSVLSDVSSNIFVTVENLGMVACIDAKTYVLKGMYPIGPDKQPSCMAMDKGNNDLLIGCPGTNELVILNVTSSAVVATLPIGMHCFGVCYMQSQKEMYTSNGEGSITVFHQVAPFNFEKKQTLITKRGVRTMTCDYLTKSLFLPTAEFDDVKKEFKKDSFQLLVVSR